MLVIINRKRAREVRPRGAWSAGDTEPVCFTRKLWFHTPPREPQVHPQQITRGRDRTKREVSTRTIKYNGAR